MPQSFILHEIEWTKERAERLWSWITSRQSYETLNFAYLAGDDVIAFAERNGVPLKGRILDFGCGPGFLVEKLLLRGLPCEGLDFSRVSVDMAHKRLSRFEQFAGVTLAESLPTPFQKEHFNVVFMLETIEHILDDDLVPTVQELHRIMTQHGYLVVTTPNEENLKGGKTLCPECGCIYHRGQHVQSWSVGALSSFMSGHGFKTIACETKNLRSPSKLNFFRDILSVLTHSKHLNLLYVGQKV